MNKLVRKRTKSFAFFMGFILLFGVISIFVFPFIIKNSSYIPKSSSELAGDASKDLVDESEILSEQELFKKLAFAVKELDSEKLRECVDYQTNFDINSDYENLMKKAFSILSYEFYEEEGITFLKGKHSDISAGINKALENEEDVMGSLILYYKENPILVRNFDFVIEKDGDKLKLTQELLELITCGFY